jgi:hypothetical protein
MPWPNCWKSYKVIGDPQLFIFLLVQKNIYSQLVMSKTKGQTFRYRFENETKMFGTPFPKFSFWKTDSLDFVQNLLS